ncbi:MAG: hypothetical protein U0794_08385 [Isosphaeraceae bacterium]
MQASAETGPDRAAFETAYPKAANDLAGLQVRMNDSTRLRPGKSIGSGMIVGTIVQLIGLRLEQTGARWKTHQGALFMEVVALDSGPEWESYTAAA